MKIYTKTGDGGDTGLYGGDRRSKSDQRIVAYGSVDELQAVLGVAETYSQGISAVLAFFPVLQKDCFVIACELARTETKASRKDPVLEEARVTWLEERIDQLSENVPELTRFIQQGGGLAGAHLHLARAVCRRAEREVVQLSTIETEKVSPIVQKYLNRLSDFLFVLARTANHLQGVEEQEISLN